MSVLRGIEHRIESFFEGVFGRAFRSHVQPVELARKLVKEMDDHRSVSVSRVYVPNEYVLYLSPRDRDQFRGYEQSLLEELAAFLAEHARREGYSLLSTPRVRMEEDADLAVGEFGIATRLVQPPERVQPRQAVPAPGLPPAPEPALGNTRVYQPTPTPPVGEATEAPPPPPERFVLAAGSSRHDLDQSGTSLGRSKDCDIVLTDPNVSRRHAEITVEDGRYWLVDLGSTNGTEVNGARIERVKLAAGDVITLGRTEFRFEPAP